MIPPLFTGCAAALVTPFTQTGSIDEPALLKLIDMQLEAGMDAIVLLGTTGEPSTLSPEERKHILTLSIRHIDGKIPVIVGTGSNNTKTAVYYAQQAYMLGADGQLCVTPYYNKTTQEGLIRHFCMIMDASPLPMIVYNVPTRTGMSMEASTLRSLCAHPMLAGIKEASGSLPLAAEIQELMGPSFAVYAGNDDLILPLMAQGAVGAISVVANILPLQTRAITTACLNGCYLEAQEAQAALMPMIRALFSQVSPIPIKAALAELGWIEDSLRLPLVPMEEPYRAKLKAVMQAMHMLKA